MSGGGWNAHHNAIARGGNDCDTWKFEWMLQPMYFVPLGRRRIARRRAGGLSAGQIATRGGGHLDGFAGQLFRSLRHNSSRFLADEWGMIAGPNWFPISSAIIERIVSAVSTDAIAAVRPRCTDPPRQPQHRKNREDPASEWWGLERSP